MEAVIKALLDEGVSADQFRQFMSDYGLQEDAYIQSVLNQLISNEVQQHSWDADSFLDFLKSPEKTPL